MVNLKALRQRAADLDGKMAGYQQRAQELSQAIDDLQTTVAASETKVMTDEQRQSLATFRAQVKTNREMLTLCQEERAQVSADLVTAEAAHEADRRAPDPMPVVEVADMTKKPGYFGAQLLAVRRAAYALKEGGSLSAGDRDLLKPMQAAATGLHTDVGSEGGFLVTQERASTILQRAYSQGQVLSRVNRMPIGPGSNGMVINAIDETSRADGSRYGGIVSTWVGQGTAVTAGKPKFRQIDLKLRKIMATLYATDEQMSDSVALEAWVNRYLPLELTFRTEDAVLNGIGSNQPLGVLNSGSLLTLTRTSASRILSEDLRGMVNRLWAPLWPRAAFFVDQSTLGEFDQLGIAVGTAGYADPSYRPAGGLNGGTYATYKNIPIIPVEYCAALGTSGDIVLAGLDEYVLIDKGGVEQAVSIHVAFLTDEQVFRFIYRVDGQLTWNSALTPKSGGSTLSCAVVLS